MRAKLALITLGTTFATAGFFLRGSPADKAKGPPIGASSKEEESFVKYARASRTVDTRCIVLILTAGTSLQRQKTRRSQRRAIKEVE